MQASNKLSITTSLEEFQARLMAVKYFEVCPEEAEHHYSLSRVLLIKLIRTCNFMIETKLSNVTHFDT